MKKHLHHHSNTIAIVAFFVIVILIASASRFYKNLQKETDTSGRTSSITLSVNQEKKLNDITVHLNKITGDSRCPQNVQCISRGEATIQATFTRGKVFEIRDLGELSAPFVFEGNTITITSVAPEKTTGTISENEYKITLSANEN